MSQTATTSGETQLGETTELPDGAVLSFNGHETEFTRGELVRICNGLSEGRENARSDDRPHTGGSYWDLRQKINDAIDS